MMINIRLKNMVMLVFILNTSTYGQNITKEEIRPEIATLIEQIIETGAYTGGSLETTSFGGGPSKADYAYHKLKEIATEEELIYLTNHKHSSVRCYSFIGLAESESNQVFEVLTEHLKDNENVHRHLGCIHDIQKVGDFFIDVVTANHPNPNGYKLNIQEKAQLDSLFIFDSSIILDYKAYLIKRLKPNEQYYHVLKKYYEAQKSSAALIAIAKFQKEEDKILFMRYLSDDEEGNQIIGLHVIPYFHSYDFFPFIEKIYKQTLKEEKLNHAKLYHLYRALVQYKTAYSKELLMEALRDLEGKIRNTHINAINAAIRTYSSPIYMSVLEKIKQLKSVQKD